MYEEVKEYFKEKRFLKEIQEKGCYKKIQEKAHTQIENKGGLSDRRYRVDGATERMEGFEKPLLWRRKS